MSGPTMTSVWFGPEDRATFGWLHIPAGGKARGVVVLCPSLGSEHLVGHLTLRKVAANLVEQGVGVLRFDYPGTGDSAGDLNQENLVRSWIHSVSEAVAFARSCGREDSRQ